MRMFTHCLSQGRGLAPVLVERANRVILSWDIRQKSRFHAVDEKGIELAVSLPRGQVIRGGDVLVGQSNELLCVIAANQSLLKITSCFQHGNHFDLMRAAYHLGNRHVSLELRPDVILIETDPVLMDMLQRMHLDVEEIDAPFEPESGAYNSVSHSEHHHGHHPHPHGHG